MKAQLNVRWREVVPRIVADFAVVQLAALTSLVSVMIWRLYASPLVNGAQVARILADYYASVFFPLSVIFPVVFLLSGIYTQSRAYAIRYKWRVILQGCALGTLIFLFANFLLTRVDVLPRSAAVMFVLLVAAGTIGARWIITLIVKSELPRAAATVAESRPSGTILVVGGAGYIGSILCRQLLALGKRVRVLDSLIYGDAPVRELLGHARFELIPGDCRNIQNVVSAIKGVDSIIHLAAIVGDPACEQDQQTALEVNYAATRMLVEIAKGNGVSRFLFASSCSVYGATDELMDEMSAVEPISLYARTKLDSESALLKARTSGFHPVILRLATVFGHSFRPRFDLVVNLLCGRAHADRVITIFNGEQWRPFIHVGDVASGFITALNAPLELVSGETFNLGDSHLNHTLSEVAETIRVVFPNTRVEHVSNSDRRNYRVSFEKLRNRLGFRCFFNLGDGIREMKRVFDGEEIRDYQNVRYHNQRFLRAVGSPGHRDELDVRVMAAFVGSLPLRYRATPAGQPARGD